MLLGTVQLHGDKLSSLEVKDICNSLDTHTIRILSLRGCTMSDKDFHRLAKSVADCKSVIQLNLNLGVVNSEQRVHMLAKSMTKNSLHGSPIGDECIGHLCSVLASHPSIVSLDLGDCIMGDKGLTYVTQLLPRNGAKLGLTELTLSANPNITTSGWAKFFIALAACSSLQALYLDYTILTDYGAGCLAVALSANTTLEVLDCEGTGITEHGAKVLLHLFEHYNVSLKSLVLAENRIRNRTLERIADCLGESDVQSEDGDSTTVTSQTTEVAENEMDKSESLHSLASAHSQESHSADLPMPVKMPPRSETARRELTFQNQPSSVSQDSTDLRNSVKLSPRLETARNEQGLHNQPSSSSQDKIYTAFQAPVKLSPRSEAARRGQGLIHNQPSSSSQDKINTDFPTPVKLSPRSETARSEQSQHSSHPNDNNYSDVQTAIKMPPRSETARREQYEKQHPGLGSFRNDDVPGVASNSAHSRRNPTESHSDAVDVAEAMRAVLESTTDGITG